MSREKATKILLQDVIMRWSYKTVHYELKKEGLLGSTFLDESEVEQSLNEYGKAGWELVSILETQDGLIAVFKQPLGDNTMMHTVEEASERPHAALQSKKENNFIRQPDLLRGGSARVSRSAPPAVSIEEYEIVVDEQEEEEKKSSKTKDDIGTIRIE